MVSHHGSDRNASIEFFDSVYTDYYVISANGRDDKPSLDTLREIVESGKNRNNSKKIILTNRTPNLKIKLNKYDKKPLIMNVLF